MVNEALKNREAFTIRERILAENGKGNMVARRLIWLLGQVDLSEVTQILDIGSRDIGQSIEFANIFQHARVDAFEPAPASYHVCLQRLKDLDSHLKDRIRVHNVTLSDSKGEIPFYAVNPALSSYPNVGASSMFRFKENLNGPLFGYKLVQDEIKVQATTLDGWCKENNVRAADMIWMDVQGAELLVLRGATETLRNTKVILTEVGLKPYYEGHTLKADIDALLFAQGFKELKNAFELNGFDYEANAIYIKS